MNFGLSDTQQAIKDLTYAYTNFEQSPAYMRMNGRPVVTFFDPDRYGTLNWALIQSSVPGNPLFIFRNSGGFTHASTSGSFAWITIDTTNTNNWAQVYLDNFFSAGLTYPAEHTMATGYKGFNDTLAAWTKNRIMSQQCGQVWLNTFAEASRYYSPTNQLESLQLATWNDYEEGSELETGVDNCVTVSASVNGTSLNWAIAGGSENTIDHYTVFVSTDGQNLMSLGDVPAGTTTLDLSGANLAPAAYTLYVKAVGRPSIVNKMSAAVSYRVNNQPPAAVMTVTPNSGKSPLTVTADASASSDADGSVAGVSIDFGDGSKAGTGPLATHTYTAPGNYVVTATVTDNLGATATAAQTVNVINQPPVAVLSLTPGTGVAPVTVTASTASSSDPDGSVQSSIINFGDGTAASGPSASHTYSTPGSYTVTATVYDNLGASATATQIVTVSANKPPVAALTVTPTSGIAPVSVTASTAGSSDPDGAIASTSINFGDGTVVGAASATHTYTIAGTYTVTATVTDNLGASSAASKTVSVTAPITAAGVIVSSPIAANGPITGNVHVVASATSPAGITAMRIYVDYVSVYSISAAAIDTAVVLAAGQHNLTVQAWDAAGKVYKNTQVISVAAGNQPPVARLSVTPSSGVAPVTVSASNSASTDADGSIASRTIDFGDGTVVSATTASHTYAVAGNYTVKTTVTDNLGATSSATQTVTVSAPAVTTGVTVSSPTPNGAAGSPVHFTAKAVAPAPIVAMKIYVDHISVYSVSAAQLDTSVAITTGVHSVTVQAWDSNGVVYKNSFTLTVN